MAITLDGTNGITSPNQYVNGNLGIDTSFLVATLCKAIQELTARVEQLEAK